MKSMRIITGLLLLTLLLSACQAASSTTDTAATNAPGSGTPISYPTIDYPPAIQAVAETPGQDGVEMVDGYPVMPGDENKAAANFYLEIAELRPSGSDSAKTDLFVAGQLPTSCHEIRAYVPPPDENKVLAVRVYSVADKDKVCTQALLAYEGVVTTFSELPAGTYIVTVNGIQIGEFVNP